MRPVQTDLESRFSGDGVEGTSHAAASDATNPGRTKHLAVVSAVEAPVVPILPAHTTPGRELELICPVQRTDFFGLRATGSPRDDVGVTLQEGSGAYFDIKTGEKKFVKFIRDNVAARFEIQILNSLRDKTSIVQLERVLEWVEKEKPTVGLQFALHRCVRTMLQSSHDRKVLQRPASLRKLSSDMSSALALLHGMGIFHNDVSIGNILFDGTHFIISDFGVSYSTQQFGANILQVLASGIQSLPNRSFRLSLAHALGVDSFVFQGITKVQTEILKDGDFVALAISLLTIIFGASGVLRADLAFSVSHENRLKSRLESAIRVFLFMSLQSGPVASGSGVSVLQDWSRKSLLMYKEKLEHIVNKNRQVLQSVRAGKAQFLTAVATAKAKPLYTKHAASIEAIVSIILSLVSLGRFPVLFFRPNNSFKE